MHRGADPDRVDLRPAWLRTAIRTARMVLAYLALFAVIYFVLVLLGQMHL